MGKIINDLIEQKLFELMESKSFENLTVDEKEFVENNFSEQEYSAQSEMIGELEELEQEAYNDKTPRKPLITTAPTKGFEIKKLLIFNVPSYAVAASLILAIAIPFMFKKDHVGKSEDFTKTESTRNDEFLSDSINIEPIEKLSTREIEIALFADSMNTIKIKQVVKTTLGKPKGRSAKDDPFDIFYSAI
jgi:hypothetical protein